MVFLGLDAESEYSRLRIGRQTGHVSCNDPRSDAHVEDVIVLPQETLDRMGSDGTRLVLEQIHYMNFRSSRAESTTQIPGF